VSDPKTLDDLALFVGYVAPGLIILWVRSRFLSGRLAPSKDALLTYLTLSAVFLFIVQVVLFLATGTSALPHALTSWWPVISFIGAAVFGVVLGLEAAHDLSRRLLGRFGIRIASAHETAWDWTFSRLRPCFMIVTLKDGSVIAGWCGERSFIGSDPVRRDIFLEQVYDASPDGTSWVVQVPGRSIYIAGTDVKTIEMSLPNR
jgi:hypothetical protein